MQDPSVIFADKLEEAPAEDKSPAWVWRVRSLASSRHGG
jgi:hypothetical protein